MTDDSSHFRRPSTSTHPHPPMASSSTEAVPAQRTEHTAGMSTDPQHAHSRRSQEHSRSNGKTATPIHSLYSSQSYLTNAPILFQQLGSSGSSTTRRAPSPLVHHHSTSMSSSAGNAPAAEPSASHAHMPVYNRQPPPGVPPQLATNYHLASLRSTSRPSVGESVHSALGALPLPITRKNSSVSPGVILAESLHASSTTPGQVQRVDVKRLMSKPRAILSPSSIPSRSVLSVSAHRDSSKTHASTSSSLSDVETADRKASIHSLNIGRRRRSRTMDELTLTTSMSMPIRRLQANLATSSTMTPMTPTVPTHSDTPRPHQAAGPSFTTGETATTALKSPTIADPVRLKEVTNTTGAFTDFHMDRTTTWLDAPSHVAVPPARQASSLDLYRTRDLTPASALVLAWNESQRRQPQRPPDSSSSRLPSPPPSPGKTPPLPLSQNARDANTWNYGSYENAASGSLFDSSTRGGNVVAVGGPETGTKDPHRVWATVEEKLRQTTRDPTTGNPIKELKRRVTGRFSRGKDKKKEREREKRSESIGTFPHPSAYSAVSSKPGVPQHEKPEHGTNRQPTGNLVIPQPRGSSLTALSTLSRKSWGNVTNASNPTTTGSYQSQVTPTGSATDVNRSEYAHSPRPSMLGSELSQTPAASVRMRSRSPAPSRSVGESAEGEAGKLWKLVRKLSNGALRQRFSNEQDDSSVSAPDVPPVPALPKNFELVDHHAYISERNQKLAQGKTSWVGPQRVTSPEPIENPGTPGTQSTFTVQSPPIPSSNFEQPLTSVLPIPLPLTSPVSRPLLTMPKLHTQHGMPNINALSPRPYPPKGRHTGRTPAHKPSSSQQSITTSGNSASMSGNEFSFRSTSPGFSSSVTSDVTSSKVLTSPYSRPSSVSSGSELNTTTVAHAIARPIMPPDELFRIRQEESFARRVQSDVGHGGASSGRVQPRGPRTHIRHNNRNSVVNKPMFSSPTSLSPPSDSPVAAHPLPVPPRHQRFGNIQLGQARAQTTHAQTPPLPTEQALSMVKNMQHPLIPRPLSTPPGSPLMPSFANDRPANRFDSHPISQHTRSSSLLQSGSVAPLSSSSSSIGDSLSPTSRFGSFSSVNALSPPPVRRRVAKTSNPMHYTSSIARHIEGNVANLSLSTRKSFPVLDDHSPEAELEEATEKNKRLRLNTSNSLLAKVRSRNVKSSSTSPSTDPLPTTSKSAPAGLSYEGKQRERSKSAVEVGRSGTPIMPFTATAFAFRELYTESPVAKPSLTEQEREDRWTALLAESDRAGGTLTARLEGEVLLSDTISIAED